jgi:superfamily I DNA/RNA helicase
MTPTEEQLAILEAAKSTNQNLMVVALAGTGKTSTLEMLSKVLADTPILSLAFNKRIADEMVKRLPSHVEPRTMNSVGHRVWGSTCGKRLSLDKDKLHKIATGLISEASQREKSQLYEDLSETLRFLRYAKRDGLLPRSGPPGVELVSFDSFCNHYGEEPPNVDFFQACLARNVLQGFAGNIDFDDQLYMPVCFGGSWPRYLKVMCDEVQDLSPINHVMLHKLASGSRLIAVGDPWQSIYGFRGAVQNGMAVLTEKFNMLELPLSVTFRVPQAGVRNVWSRVPHYRAHHLNPEGTVSRLTEWGPNSVPDHAFILCRNNAPLFSLALKLIRARRSVKLVGMEIGPGLVRVLKKLGPLNMTNAVMLTSIDAWEQAQLSKARSAEVVAERAECLRVLCEGKPHLEAAIRDTESLFASNGPIQLMSIHKAKGLEAETVFFLDAWRIPSKYAIEGTEEYQQELNCHYVACTRFKETLYFIDLEDYHV